MAETSHAPTDGSTFNASDALRAELLEVALRDRWDRALMAIGWLHLGIFSVNQVLIVTTEQKWPHLALWVLDVLGVLFVMRSFAGKGWAWASSLGGILFRVWVTFLILAFNAVSMNVLMGLDPRWYVPAWTGLSTFGFATTAWLCGWRFLIPAVLMYFTGLAAIAWPNWDLLIYGVAWCGALQGIGWRLARRRAAERTLSRAQPGRRAAEAPVRASASPSGSS